MIYINLEIRVFSGLEKYIPGATFGRPFSREVPEKTTGRQLLEHLGIPEEHVFSILVNGRHRPFDELLCPGDRVALFPPVGGG